MDAKTLQHGDELTFLDPLQGHPPMPHFRPPRTLVTPVRHQRVPEGTFGGIDGTKTVIVVHGSRVSGLEARALQLTCALWPGKNVD